MISGCKKPTQLTCMGTYNKDKIIVSAEIVANFDKEERLNNAKIEYDFHDAKKANEYCTQLKQLQEVDNIDVSCVDTKVISEGFTIIDVATNTVDYLDKTKDDFMKIMDDLAFTCK